MDYKDRIKTLKKLGKRIRDLREFADISQQQLSDRCDVTKNTISKIELAQTDPVYTTLEDLRENGFGMAKEEFEDYNCFPERLKKLKNQ